jgi:hypothetical protein
LSRTVVVPARPRRREQSPVQVGSAAITPTPATTHFLTSVAAWAANTPKALLGVLCVLEGAHNGGRHIARRVAKSFSLGDGCGTSFLDPHGEWQTLRWREVKEDVDRSIDANDIDLVVGAAQATFDALAAICQSIGPHTRANDRGPDMGLALDTSP